MFSFLKVVLCQTFQFRVLIASDSLSGFFSGSNQKRLEGARNDVPIFEAKMTSDLRLIYQIDIDVDCYLQVRTTAASLLLQAAPHLPP